MAPSWDRARTHTQSSWQIVAKHNPKWWAKQNRKWKSKPKTINNTNEKNPNESHRQPTWQTRCRTYRAPFFARPKQKQRENIQNASAYICEQVKVFFDDRDRTKMILPLSFKFNTICACVPFAFNLVVVVVFFVLLFFLLPASKMILCQVSNMQKCDATKYGNSITLKRKEWLKINETIKCEQNYVIKRFSAQFLFSS